MKRSTAENTMCRDDVRTTKLSLFLRGQETLSLIKSLPLFACKKFFLGKMLHCAVKIHRKEKYIHFKEKGEANIKLGENKQYKRE